MQTRVRAEHDGDRRYTVGGVGVAIQAPREVLRVLDLTLLYVPQREAECTVFLSVEQDEESWRISDEYGPLSAMPVATPVPQVAGALTTAMVERVGTSTKDVVLSGAIVAKDGFAVALIGNYWESCIAIAAHLSLRGWSFVTPRYSFVDPETREVEPFAKLLYVPARIISQLPLPYRRAVEASPWHSTDADLGFYAVNLHTIPGVSPDVPRPILRAGIVIDASRGEQGEGSIYEPAPPHLGSLVPFAGVGLASASVVTGGVVSTTNTVERWLSGLTAAY